MQKKWEDDRVKRLGATHILHTIAPDFEEYFNTLRVIVGPPAEVSEAYELPMWEDEWVREGFRVLELKDEFVREIREKEKLFAKL